MGSYSLSELETDLDRCIYGALRAPVLPVLSFSLQLCAWFRCLTFHRAPSMMPTTPPPCIPYVSFPSTLVIICYTSHPSMKAAWTVRNRLACPCIHLVHPTCAHPHELDDGGGSAIEQGRHDGIRGHHGGGTPRGALSILRVVRILAPAPEPAAGSRAHRGIPKCGAAQRSGGFLGSSGDGLWMWMWCTWTLCCASWCETCVCSGSLPCS
mmetsp:Transcript_5189/g.32580  ORF Transcript_5189/g.32580 Transcript_5189/m.32580 type:complete len:210 (-) Transcript_5189:2880-3509(-)